MLFDQRQLRFPTLSVQLGQLLDIVGGDLETAHIERAFGPYVIIRDDPGEARRVLDAALAHNHDAYDGDPDVAWLGPPEYVAERWRPYLPLGFRHLIASLATPYDHETIERLVQVRDLL